VTGWALLSAATVARVEVRVDGLSAGLARLGLPRPNIAAQDPTGASRPEAPVCGFEFRVHPSALPLEGHEVDVDAVAHGLDGSHLTLSAVTCRVAPSGHGSSATDPRIAGLRERVRRVSGRTASTPTKDVRLLVFASRPSPSGGRDLYHLLRGLVKEPALYCVVLTAERGPLGRKLEAAGVPVHLTSDCSMSDAERYEGKLTELAAWASAQRFNVSLVHGPDAGMGVDLATRLGIPAVWAADEGFGAAESWDARGVAVGSERARAEEALTRPAALLFSSDAARAPFVRDRGSDRLVTLRPGTETEEVGHYKWRVGRKAASRRLGLTEDTSVVLCLDTISAEGGQVPLVQAFASIAERYPNVILALVGDQASPYSRGLHEYVDRAGLSSRVVIAPEPEDPYVWHRTAHVFVCASDRPVSPSAAIAAMAFETPVLATRASGLGELIEDGKSGYLCDDRDVEQLAVGLQRALGAPGNERERVAQAAIGRSVEQHCQDAYAGGVSRLLAALLEDARARPTDALSRSRTSASGALRTVPETVSVMVPTRDAGPGFARSLESILAQKGVGGLEIVVVDSGSTDDTVAVARRAGARVAEIDPEEFNHGRVRNHLADMSRGDVLLATVQDATLSSRYAVRDLVLDLREDTALAAVSALQVPGGGADLYSIYQAWQHNEDLFRHPPPPEGTPAWAGALVDDVCAAIRRPAWEQVRFRELPYGEDIDFGIRATGRGWQTAFSEHAVVEHHHDRGADHLLRRSVVHRLLLAELLADLERTPEAGSEGEVVAAALPSAVGQLEAALSLTLADRASVTLGPFLEALKVVLQADLPSPEATGELASICRLVEDRTGPVAPSAVKGLKAWMVHALFDPWLLPFALAHPEPVPYDEVRSFVTRLVASNLGRILADAMRDAPGSPLAARLGRGI
jgi:GT2 family glycosyltransferase